MCPKCWTFYEKKGEIPYYRSALKLQLHSSGRLFLIARMHIFPSNIRWQFLTTEIQFPARETHYLAGGSFLHLECSFFQQRCTFSRAENAVSCIGNAVSILHKNSVLCAAGMRKFLIDQAACVSAPTRSVLVSLVGVPLIAIWLLNTVGCVKISTPRGEVFSLTPYLTPWGLGVFCGHTWIGSLNIVCKNWLCVGRWMGFCTVAVQQFASKSTLQVFPLEIGFWACALVF